MRRFRFRGGRVRDQCDTSWGQRACLPSRRATRLQTRSTLCPSLCNEAWTLIELLCVLAILVLLAALLFPVFAAVKRASTSAGCLSNLRQQYVALLNYTHSWDDAFPVIYFDWDGSSYPSDWSRERQAAWERANRFSYPHVMSRYAPEELFHCPADTGLALPGDDDAARFVPFWERFGTSYRPAAELGTSGLTLDEVPRPGEIFWAMDAAGFWHTRYSRAPPAGEAVMKDFRRWQSNVVFLDGHEATKSTLNEIWDPYVVFLESL